ncbi:MAG: YbaB/EbfC family nucleoid-associated protein [Bacteroidia bacterium]
MFDIFEMLGKLGDIKERIAEARESLKHIVITESDPKSLVKVRVTASMEVQQIQLADELIASHSRDEIEKILTQTVSYAITKAKLKAKEEMKNKLEGVVPDIPGFDLDSLGLG